MQRSVNHCEKKIECKQSFFFTLYYVFCINCTCILIIKKLRDIIYSFWGANLNKTEKWKTAFFLLYNNNTTPRSSTKSYNKNRSRLISACLLFSCNFTHDNIEDTDFTGELIPTILKEFKSCPCHLTSNISCIYSLGFFCKLFIYARIKR